MQIKRLRLTGFKSFVEPTEIRIEPGLTGLVGPNGCGKSNLLEALRWTMGEGSARSLRGAGMDDVIFAGTATRPPRNLAEVSILAEVDGQEREVVRRIERGAGSAYRIDGRDVRARDVALLFADAATGAHSPALVSQGRIGAVIAAKPAERRAMLEEAAGIAGLHVRRKDAEVRLRATEANLARIDELVADGEARAAALRRQARAAARYRGLSADIRLAEARMIYARWRDADAAAEAAGSHAAAAEVLVAAAAGEERSAANARDAVAAAVGAARVAALEARDRASEAGHRLTGLRADKVAAERRLVELVEATQRLTDDRAREGALGIDAAAALDRLAGEAREHDTRVAAAAERAPGLDGALANAERAARDAEIAHAQALTRQASDVAEARIAAAALAAGREQAARTDREHRAAAAALAALPQSEPLAAARDTAAAHQRDALTLADAARAMLAASDSDARAASSTHDTAVAARAAARAELATLDAEIAALARASQRGTGERLLDHVTARPGYERALAAALDDCLATPLDAWGESAARADDPSPPTGTVALSTVVSAPPQLARRLAQVLVAEADDDAPLAVGQRLVTRAGAVRRWDGYRAEGGGAAVAERLERLNRLDALGKGRPPLAAALAQADAAYAEAETAIAKLRHTAVETRASLQAADTQARDAAREQDRAEAALERRAGQAADLQARVTRAAADQDTAASVLATAEAAQSALPDTTASAREAATLGRIADERRAAVAAVREERAALARTLATSRERLASIAAEAKSWRTRAGEAARRVADMAKRESTLADEATALADRPAWLADTIAEEEAAHIGVTKAATALATAERTADADHCAAEDAHRAATETLARAREDRAGSIVRAETEALRRVEMGRIAGERFQCSAPMLPAKLAFAAAAVDTPTAEAATHARLAQERERIGPVNLVAEQELADLEVTSTGLAAEREELGQAVNRLRGSIGTLNREGRQRLLAAFEAVNGHFQRLFTGLFDGGAARLELIDSDDPLEAGLEILAQPPGKRLQSLTLLSGGEQALTAVALIFALFLTNPAPICVLDEVDAPLDDANIERFCTLLDRMVRETATRYIVVTHNAVTMSRMHRLFGVTMIERGVSRLVSVDLQAAESLLAAE